MLYFIVNENARSGRGGKIWSEVQRILHQEHISYKAWVTKYEGHAFSLAAEICEKEDPDICLVVVGGDGTLNEAINGMTHFEKVRFGVIPTGSGNDFARGLGIRGGPAESLREILSCAEAEREACCCMDLGQVIYPGARKPRLFAISAGVGLDALVCKKALKSKVKDLLNWLRLGRLTYLFLTVQSLFTMETTDAAVYFDRRGQQNRRRAICFAVMNFPAEGGGVPMAPNADAADGRLSICSIWGIPKWRTFFCLPFLMAKKQALIRGFEVNDCQECEIKLKKPMVLHADGEYCSDVTEMQFKCLPGKLCVLKQKRIME